MAVSSDGKTIKQLGQRDSYKQATYRQFDGSILDWLPDQPGSVLMARHYVPEVVTTGSNISDDRAGLGVDRIDLASLKVSQVEKPRDRYRPTAPTAAGLCASPNSASRPGRAC